MKTAQFQNASDVADIVVLDKHEKPFLLVVVKAKKTQEISDQKKAVLAINNYLQNTQENKQNILQNNPFIMLVDLISIVIFTSGNNNFSNHRIEIHTGKILSNYDDNFNELTNNNRISKMYLITLVEAWLRDLAYHWQSTTPAGTDKLKDIGLLQQIEGGITCCQVNFDGDTVY